MVAFIVSFIIANIIYWGGMVAIVIILVFVLYLVYRTHILHKNREAEKMEDQDTEFTEEILSASVVLKKCQSHAVKILLQVPEFYENLVKGL